VELASDFSTFLSSIQPGDSDIADAKAAHETVRDRLRTDDESKDAHRKPFSRARMRGTPRSTTSTTLT